MAITQIEKVETYLPGFDLVAQGGLPAGSATLVAGTPGSGKTVFGVHFLAGGIREAGAGGVFVTFEDHPVRLRRYMGTFGWDIEQWEADKQWAFVDASLQPSDPPTTVSGPYEFGGLVTRIEAAVRKVKAKRVVLDSISSVIARFREQQTVRHELHRVAEALRAMKVTSIITAERLIESSDTARFGFEDFIADNVIILRNRLEEEKRRRTVEILKFRGASHQKGEFPFSISSEDGFIVIPLSEMRLTQQSLSDRITSGVQELDKLCGGGFFEGSIILITGATGCGKTLATAEFAKGGISSGDRTLLFGYEESQDQLVRNATGWGVDFEGFEAEGKLRVVCGYPESSNLEDHLLAIRKHIDNYQPQRLIIDSLSALERISTHKTFREFVIALTGLLKERQVTSLLTLTTPNLMGGSSVTEGHISSIADSIILLRYVELPGEVRRGLTVLKMRGSQHDKEIREFTIDSGGMHIGRPFRNITGVLSGNPVYRSFEDRIEDII
ncbi:MAG: circadian clock protein KaiC [Gemmataceae bacterium]